MDWNAVESARQKAEGAAQTAVDYSSKGNTLVDELRKTIGERYSNSNIPTNTAKARTDYLAAAPQARSQVMDLINAGSILSPTQQNAILSAKRASALMPLESANLMEGAAQGTIEDLINAGINAWKAKSSAAEGAAQIAQGGYTSLLNQLLQKAQEDRATVEASRADELFPLQKQKLLADIAATNRSNLGGGGSTSLTPIEINGVMYNYNPRTGEYTKANVQGGRSKYDEQDIVNFANAIVEGRSKLNGVPSEIRGQVDAVAQQIQASKPNIFQQGWNWLSGLFQ
jgi:hypothetical protein